VLQVSLLSCPKPRKFYRIESLHTPGTSPDSCRAQRLMEKAPCMIAFGVKLNNFKAVGIEFGILVRDGILVHA
jgi:hypothetical protein